jgi:hypothetical protein
VYEPGHAAGLAACLASVTTQEACDIEPVDACVGNVYDYACDSDFIKDTCTDFVATCEELDDTLDFDRCDFELRPFSEAGLIELVTCMNDETVVGDCQARYDACLDAVLTID